MIGVHKEAFQLCYHTDGFQWSDVWWKMPVYLRRFYLRQLKNQKDREQEQIQQSKNKGGNSGGDEFSGEGIPDDYKSELSATDREKPELHEMMENAPPDVKRDFENG